MTSTALEIPTARVFRPLLEPGKRYRAAWGGRGGAKSWFFADLLIDRFIENPTLRAVCVREVQKSLAESVKQLLEDRIQTLGVGPRFRCLNTHIETEAGGRVLFQGMSTVTAESVKSLEGIDIAWVEEAQTLSQRSLDLLRPTIRKDGSEIWCSWNPRRPEDPVDAFFRGPKGPPDDAVVVKALYTDNPWLTARLRQEAEQDRQRDPDKYAHVWLGEYERISEARVFKNWRVGKPEEFTGPTDGMYYFGADWGFSTDPTTLIRCYLHGRTLYLDREVYGVGIEIDATPAFFDTLERGQARKWPIIADSARPETISYLQRHGYPKLMAAKKGPNSVEDGVAFLQSYDLVIHPSCQHAIREFSLYSYKVDRLTEQVVPILEDKDNHCIAEGAMVACRGGDKPIESVRAGDEVLTRVGYRRVINAWCSGYDKEVVCVVTTGGRVSCTPDHKIYTSQGFKRADALRYNDEVLIAEPLCASSVLSGTDGNTVVTLIASVGRIAATLRGLFLAAFALCTETCGSTITALFPKATTSTTSTAIPSITPSTIWPVFRQPSTRHSTRSPQSRPHIAGSIWTPYGTLLSLGIAVPKAERSTERLGLWRIVTSLALQSHAPNAAESSRRKPSVTETSSAPTTASLPIDAPVAWTTKIARAWNAAKAIASAAASGRRLVAARVQTVSALGRSRRVYDLSVDRQHEFFADGVLVSNCPDALRYAIEPLRRDQTMAARLYPSDYKR